MKSKVEQDAEIERLLRPTQPLGVDTLIAMARQRGIDEKVIVEVWNENDFASTTGAKS